MYIKHLKIEKFRAVENVEFDFNLNINALGGDNGVGKTTVIDSILWMLSDETMVCGKDNNKNLDDNDKTKPIIVELSFEKDEGNFVLKREYRANFKDGEFKDYSNLFWINDAKYSSTDYFKRLKKEFNLENAPDVKGFNIFRALIDFDYFGTLDYKIAREVIENILHLDSAENILGKELYSSIRSDLIGQDYDIAKLKTTYNAQEKAQQNEITKTKASIEALKSNLKPFDKKLYDELKEKYNLLSVKEFEHSAEYKSAYDDVDSQLSISNGLYSELEKLRNELKLLETKNDNILKPLDLKSKEVEQLRKDFVRIQNGVKKCPNCNYELNKDEIHEELKEISIKGKKLNSEIAELKSLIKTDEINNLREQVANKEKEWKKSNELLNEKRKSADNVLLKEDEQQQMFYQEKQSKLNELNAQIYEMEKSNDTGSIEKLSKQLDAAKEELAKIEYKQEVLIDYEKEKIQAIQEKVDEVFPGIEFVLTEISDRGAEKKTCRPTYKGVDYQRLNDGQRIKIGFEIIEDLNNVLEIKDRLPIIFDKFRDLSKENALGLKDITESQIFTTFVGNEQTIKLYQM